MQKITDRQSQLQRDVKALVRGDHLPPELLPVEAHRLSDKWQGDDYILQPVIPHNDTIPIAKHKDSDRFSLQEFLGNVEIPPEEKE